MSQLDYIKDIAKYGLENDQEKLLYVLNELIEHSKNTKKLNFAIQLQSILKDSQKQQKSNALTKVGSESYFNRIEDKEVGELILEKLTSNYRLNNIVADNSVKHSLEYFIEEHQKAELLRKFDLPIANKLLLHGPSGCGKTLASYVVAGELERMMVVVNLGAIVSSKLGETSKNLSKIFRKASSEDCIIFIDEFDSLGKVRDYSQDHGEMKRVVNTILQLFDNCNPYKLSPGCTKGATSLVLILIAAEVNALLIAISTLVKKAFSILCNNTRFPPLSTTATTTGIPKDSAFSSAALAIFFAVSNVI